MRKNVQTSQKMTLRTTKMLITITTISTTERKRETQMETASLSAHHARLC